jgi:hypothetical protein
MNAERPFSQELWEQTQQRSRASSRLPSSDPPQAGRCWLSTKKRDSSAILMNRPLTGILSKINTMGIPVHLEPLCPDSAAWRICRIAPAQDRMVLPLEPMRTAVACPACGTDSGHVHSHFPRGDHQPRCVALLPLLPPLSRDVEELLFERGIIVTYEAIRKWCRKFGEY